MMSRVSGGESARCGISEWFAQGEYQQAEQLFADAYAAGFGNIRLAVILDQWNGAKGRAWYRWLVARASEGFKVVVALHRLSPPLYRPLPPVWVHEISAYQRFFAEVGDELGDSVQWLELADPLGAPSWPDTSPESAGLLSGLALKSAVKLCLGGLPLDARWLALANRQGLLDSLEALAFRQILQGNWTSELSKLSEVPGTKRALERWLTFDDLPSRSGSRTGLFLKEWGDGLAAAVERVYLNPAAALLDSPNQQGRGLRTADGKPALLGRLLQQGGSAKVRQVATWACRDAQNGSGERELVIGGAGFIGCNVAARLAATGHQVLLFDDLSRPGAERNLEWLCQQFPSAIEVLLADVRDRNAVQYAVRRASRIFHFAAQVAVTTSLEQPFFDHEVNTAGTLNVLEEARRRRYPAPDRPP